MLFVFSITACRITFLSLNCLLFLSLNCLQFCRRTVSKIHVGELSRPHKIARSGKVCHASVSRTELLGGVGGGGVWGEGVYSECYSIFRYIG